MVDAVDESKIAVVGLALRLPGARTADAFWRNMREGVESVVRFSDDELLEAGVAAETLEDPDYVKAAAVIEGADRFDAGFFGYSPKEAELLDPQHRLFLETAWEALEDAGHDPARLDGAAGVFAGCFMNKYLSWNLYTNREFLRSPLAVLARVFNDKDFLATRVSYLLDLRGPAWTVQTACSTSLVATHQACQSLLSYECDLALVGGVAVDMPPSSGYPVIEGGLFSPDGSCRPFDADARGTVPGYGTAIVVLRRLEDALADRDRIRAVVLGSAINNDGAGKVGFTAPSVDAQAEVIREAQSFAGVDPRSVGYVETHGSGTPLGDPIEVAALAQAFGVERGECECALGSVKANVGHLDAAAGVTGLIRAVLALEHGEIPPSANFERPNPELKLETTPFYVPTEARPWLRDGAPRRAGVSSFGIGGTNAHVVLEEPPEPEEDEPSRPWQLLLLSARDRHGLERATERLADHLREHPELPLADVAYTLQAGRHAFDVRRAVVCRDGEDAVAVLDARDPERCSTAERRANRPQVVFMFPGGGTQYPDMGRGLYRSEPVFRRWIDRCAESAEHRLGFDLRSALYPSLHGDDEAGLEQRGVPAVLSGIFATELATAHLWRSWGVEPEALIGHSLGEYAAACLSGVFRLEDALELTIRRGELFESLPEGAMMVVQLPEDELLERLDGELELSAVNAPELCVVGGRREAVEALKEDLEHRDVETRRVPIRVASHCRNVEPILKPLAELVERFELREPELPFLSSVTGTWIRPDEATDPAYWTRHLRNTVRFGDGVREALSGPDRVLLEVGPGTSLSTLAGLQGVTPRPAVFASLHHPREPAPDRAVLLAAAGGLWQAGADLDWESVHHEARRRVPLPTYPFHRRRYWVEPGVAVGAGVPQPDRLPETVDRSRPAAESGSTGADADVDVGDGFVAPRTDLERGLAAIWSEMLGIERVGVEDDFFDLGGHSLLASRMVRKVRQSTGHELQVRTLFENPTVARLARALGGGRPAAPEGVDLEAEVVLDPEIRPEDSAAEPAIGDPRAVLLTGATGFLGAWLCEQLVRQTEATVYCLVRAGDRDEAADRVRRRLREAGIELRDAEARRVVGLPGDLSEPSLGLGEDRFRELAEELDTIYHAGAWVNFARSYEALKETNVGGAVELLRLACRARVKPVHHVSTIAVLAGAVAAGADEVLEGGELPPPVGHDTGYSQSKWVAEKVLEIARDRGVPVSIYRTGTLLGDSRTGVSNPDDYLIRMIRGCVRLGRAPEREYPLPVATVDWMAAALVRLSLQEASVGRTFHVLDPDPLPWNRIFEHVRAAGYEVESVDFAAWAEALTARAEETEDEVLQPLLGLVADTADRDMPRFDSRNVQSGLRGTAVRRQQLDPELMARYLAWLEAEDLLPPPGASPGFAIQDASKAG